MSKGKAKVSKVRQRWKGVRRGGNQVSNGKQGPGPLSQGTCFDSSATIAVAG